MTSTPDVTFLLKQSTAMSLPKWEACIDVPVGVMQS